LDDDSVAGARVARETLRAGGGFGAFFGPLLDRWVYVEGARMNYRGVLVDVLYSGDGTPAGLVLDPCYRVGEWDASGPSSQYEQRQEGPHIITWGSVCEVGMQLASWPTT